MPVVGRSGSNGASGDIFSDPLRDLGTVGPNRREGGTGSSIDSTSDAVSPSTPLSPSLPPSSSPDGWSIGSASAEKLVSNEISMALEASLD